MERERRLTKSETPEAPTKKLYLNDTSDARPDTAVLDDVIEGHLDRILRSLAPTCGAQ